MDFKDRDRNEEKTAKSTPIQDSIKISSLTYPMVRPLSLVTQRRAVEHPFQLTSYTSGNTMNCDTNSGDDYIVGKGCYLKFEMTWATQAGVYGGATSAGSAINVIDNITVIHSSGTVIDKLEAVNIHHAFWSVATKSADTIGSDGAAYGFRATNAATTKFFFTIPLGEICGLFARDKPIPSMLASGLRFVIQLATNAQTTVNVAGSGTFTLTNPAIVFDQMTLTDSAQLYLQEQSSKNGLVFDFESHEHQQSGGGTSVQKYNISIFKAMSMATTAFAVARDTDNINSDAKDGFEPITATAGTAADMSLQWRIASQYYPLKAITDRGELFQWNRNQISVDYTNRPGYITPSSLFNTGVHFCRLERDHLLNYSGIPVSGSRALTYTATFAGAADDRTIDIFVHYVKLARVWGYNRIIISE